MESDRQLVSRTRSLPRGRTAARGVTWLRGRNCVGAAHRRPLAGCAAPFRVVEYLLAAPQGMDRSGNLGEGLGTLAASIGSRRAREARGVICRRNVFLGKKRGDKVGKTKRGKGTKIMICTDASGLPLAVDIASASPHEVTLIEPLLERRLLRRLPQRLIYDLAADSDPLRARLRKRGIDLICPHRV